MSLIGALNAGQSGLAVSQAAIQVTGNNISNAGDADYARGESSRSRFHPTAPISVFFVA